MAPKRERSYSYPSASSSAIKKKTKGAIKLEKATTVEDIRGFLQNFKAAIEAKGVSPPGGDKETVSKWSNARGYAMALQEKDIPIYTVPDMTAVVLLKDSYAFQGRVLLYSALVPSEISTPIAEMARAHDIPIEFL